MTPPAPLSLLAAVPEDGARRGTTLPASAIRGLELTDQMPRALRECVHEFGFPIVHAFVQLGIVEPRHIRHLVTVCWQGARSNLDRAGVSGRLGFLDAILLQSGSELTANGLVRTLKQSDIVILPLQPIDIMVDASIEETGNLGLVSKREKHRARLRAALRSGAARWWPNLFASAAALSVLASVALAQDIPGEVAADGHDAAVLCGKVDGLTYSKRHRSGTMEASLRCPQGWQSDHLVPLGAGGADLMQNLWCQKPDSLAENGLGWAAKDRLDTKSFLDICHRGAEPAAVQARFLAPAVWARSYCAAFPTDARCPR